MKMPDDRAIRRNEKDTAHKPCRNEVLITIPDHGVHMRVLIRTLHTLTGPVVLFLKRNHAVAEWKLRAVLVGTPPEEHLVGFDINLVDKTVLDPPIPGPPDRAQISIGDVGYCGHEGTVLGQSGLVGVDTRVELLLRIGNRDDIVFFTVQRDAVDLVVRAVQNADVSESKAGELDARPVHEHGLAV